MYFPNLDELTICESKFTTKSSLACFQKEHVAQSNSILKQTKVSARYKQDFTKKQMESCKQVHINYTNVHNVGAC